MIDELRLAELRETGNADFASKHRWEILDTLEAAMRVVRAAESLVFARYGIGIPLTRDPDVLGKSFDTIQAMFVPLQEALIPFRSPEEKLKEPK